MLKQTCSFYSQVCLNIYELLVDTRPKRVKDAIAAVWSVDLFLWMERLRITFLMIDERLFPYILSGFSFDATSEIVHPKTHLRIIWKSMRNY